MADGGFGTTPLCHRSASRLFLLCFRTVSSDVLGSRVLFVVPARQAECVRFRSGMPESLARRTFVSLSRYFPDVSNQQTAHISAQLELTEMGSR